MCGVYVYTHTHTYIYTFFLLVYLAGLQDHHGYAGESGRHRSQDGPAEAKDWGKDGEDCL